MLLKWVDWVVYDGMGFSREGTFGGVIQFFLYDSIKIFLLLAGMIFVIGVIRTYLPEGSLRRWMGRGGIWSHGVAALFGAITPFCSCSSLPIFISLLKADVPLGVTFSFLVTSPIINEYLVILMMGEFGVPITLAYVASGLMMGTMAGVVLGRMKLERYLEKDLTDSGSKAMDPRYESLGARVRFGYREAVQVIRQIWVWVLVGVALGAFIHNYIPQESIHRFVSAAGVFSVPIATLVGVPMYGSCAAIVPVAVVLFEKGVPLGAALAFMMSMSALSFPEAIMLRRVMQLPLIALFFGITTGAIILTGYFLNAFQRWF